MNENVVDESLTSGVGSFTKHRECHDVINGDFIWMISLQWCCTLRGKYFILLAMDELFMRHPNGKCNCWKYWLAFLSLQLCCQQLPTWWRRKLAMLSLHKFNGGCPLLHQLFTNVCKRLAHVAPKLLQTKMCLQMFWNMETQSQVVD